jgi:plastocyanin
MRAPGTVLLAAAVLAGGWGAASVRAAAPSPAASPPGPAAQAAPGGGSGTIEGRVRIELPASRQDGGDPDSSATDLRKVVVYVDAFPAGVTFAPPAREAELRQRKKSFVPYILPIQVGTSVRFPNDDELFHNVFSLSKTHAFNIGRYPHGPGKLVTFNKVGRIRVFCDIHSAMKANILVLPSPHFATSDEDGRFRLAGVPAVDCFAVAWHDTLEGPKVPVSVKSGETTRVDLVIRGSSER